jgi:hypothetical protein
MQGIFKGRYQPYGEDQNNHPAQKANKILPFILKQTIVPLCPTDDKVPLSTDQAGLEKRQEHSVT